MIYEKYKIEKYKYRFKKDNIYHLKIHESVNNIYEICGIFCPYNLNIIDEENCKHKSFLNVFIINKIDNITTFHDYFSVNRNYIIEKHKHAKRTYELLKTELFIEKML